MMAHHAVVWLDHKEAQIYHVEPQGSCENHVQAEPLRRKSQTHHVRQVKRGRPFFHAVASMLQEAHDVIIFGPPLPKLDFFEHVRTYDHALQRKILWTEIGSRLVDEPVVAYVQRAIHICPLVRDALSDPQIF